MNAASCLEARRDLLRDLIEEALGVSTVHLNAALQCNMIAADGDTRHHLTQAQTCFRTIKDAFVELDTIKKGG
jgi:hypothetical protein